MSILFIGRGLTLPSALWMRRQLEGLGKDVKVLVTESGPVEFDRNYYKVLTIRENNLRFIWRLFRWETNRKIRKAIKSKSVTRVLIHFLTDAVLLSSVIKDVTKPVFVYCHGYDVTWNLRNQFALDYGKLMHKSNYVERVLGLPEHVTYIANSKITKSRLMKIGIPESRIQINYLGVPVPAQPRQRIHNKRDLVVLYLGRLVDFKGPDIVIRAFERACQMGFKGKLIIAGSGPLDLTCELLRSHSPYKDKIIMLGAVNEEKGKDLRENADIFTAHNCTGPISNQEEAFGVSLVEAMSASLAIVNTTNGSVPEVVQNEKQGILVEPGDIEGHAKAFIKLAEDPELRMNYGLCGWKRASEKFTTNKEIIRLRQIMNIS